MRGYTISIGARNREYLEATLGGNEENLDQMRAEDKMRADSAKQKEYARMQELLTESGFYAFSQIDSMFSRHAGLTDPINYAGTLYKYTWWDTGIKATYMDYEDVNVFIRFANGLFSIYLSWCDESGYDQGQHDMETDVSPEDILKRIEALQAQTEADNDSSNNS